MAETKKELLQQIDTLQSRLDAAEEALRAIQSGEVDALVISGADGDHIYTLEGADYTYRMMVEKIQEGVATLAADGMVLYANQRLAEMLGERLESLLGNSLIDFISPYDRNTFIAMLARGGEGASRGEIDLRRRDGSSLPALMTMNSVENRGKPVIGLIAADLTEQKHHEEILAAEQLARSILEQAAEILVVCDTHGAIIRASQTAHDFLSINPLFLPFEKAFPLKLLSTPDGEGAFSMQSALQGKSFHSVEVSITLPDTGSPQPRQENFLLLSAAPLRGERHEILGCVVTLTNITERKLAEQALQESENRLRKLVEGNIIGVIRRDISGRIREANSSFLNLVGYDEEDVHAGRLVVSRLTPAQFLGVDQKAITEALATGSCKPYEKEYLHKDGHPVPVMVGYSRIDEVGEDFIGFVLDLSRLKKAQTDLGNYAERLERSNQELEQFAFVASHDMQEPLRKIIRFGDSVADRLHTGLNERSLKEINEYVERMQNAADRLQGMIDGLLELSRISTRGQEIEKVDLSKVIEEVISDIDLRIHQAGASLEINPLPVIDADPMQMRQLFQNLITNALKFHRSDAPPLISVSCEIRRDGEKGRESVVLRVQDNGIGFDEKETDWIFQPFRRLHAAHEYEGSGMGLAICKKIVERHHGTIRVHSRPGQGSTFIIELPLNQVPA